MAVDWQQFYTPSRVTFGKTQASVDAENAEKRRQAMLMAEQINQAQATTRNMGGGGTLGHVPGTPTSPSSGPSISTGTFRQPSTGTPMYTGASTAQTGVSPLSAQVQQQFDPWSKYRPAAGTQLAGEMGQASPSDIYKEKLAQMASGEFSPDDPSYQWRYQQGQQAAERSLASRGLLNSGNAAIELQQYGQGAASQEYAAQFSRMLQGLTGTEQAYDTQMQRLMQMAGVNLSPTAGGELAVQTGQLGVNAQNVANEYDLGMRELVLQQLLAAQAQANQGVGGMSGTDWSSVFGGR